MCEKRACAGAVSGRAARGSPQKPPPPRLAPPPHAPPWPSSSCRTSLRRLTRQLPRVSHLTHTDVCYAQWSAHTVHAPARLPGKVMVLSLCFTHGSESRALAASRGLQWWPGQVRGGGHTVPTCPTARRPPTWPCARALLRCGVQRWGRRRAPRVREIEACHPACSPVTQSTPRPVEQRLGGGPLLPPLPPRLPPASPRHQPCRSCGLLAHAHGAAEVPLKYSSFVLVSASLLHE